jgi:type IX secretion system PorP/SprF family membrane protein
MLRLLTISCLTLLNISVIFTQQLPVYSQYTYNKFLLNPASAGSDGYTSINLIAREQWVGFSEAPKTHGITIESRILKNSFISKNASIRRKRRLSSRSGRVGWGGHIFNDKNGKFSRTGIEGTYSYHLDIADYRLSFGLSLLLYQCKLRASELIFSDDEIDDLANGKTQSLIIPDASFGTYFASREFYAGISIMQIMQSAIKFSNKSESEYKLKRQYNFLGGYIYTLNDQFDIEPSFLLKFTQISRPQLDLNVKVSYMNDISGGLSFRTGSSLIIFTAVTVNRYYFGYAFDYNFNSLMNHTFGSHEITLAVKLGDNARRYKWLDVY